MNVLVISHTYISSINRDKWKTLAQRHPDCSITVVFPKQWPTQLFNHTAHIEPEENKNNCTFTALDSYHNGNEILYRYNHKQLYDTLKKTKPDILQVEQGAYALSYLQANLYTKMLGLQTKSIFFTWINWHPKNSFKHRFFFTPVEKINLTCATAAITGNHAAQEILQSKGFFKPILVLPQLGVNTTLFTPQQKNTKRIKRLGFIGRLTPEKGIFFLVNAFLKICNQYPDWNLLFIGDGPARQQLHSFIASKHMQSRIELCNVVSHHTVAHMLKNIDILILPSYDKSTWREQFGHVLIEAMACQIPVIGSDAGEIPHVIADGGLIFKQKNEASLLAQLQFLMQDESLRKAIGTRGLNRAREHYTNESIADETYNFWQKILKKEHTTRENI